MDISPNIAPSIATESVEQKAIRKANLLQAISMLDSLLVLFSNAPEKVRMSAKQFRDALEEWSNAG